MIGEIAHVPEITNLDGTPWLPIRYLNDFQWGDVVIVKSDTPEKYKPGFQGCVCGIRTIDSLVVAKQFDQSMNTELFLIEFGDGITLEIPKLSSVSCREF